ncbi:MAG: Ig-like domain-containing protein [Methylococcales bacterium]
MNQFNPKKSQLTGTRWLARHILLASMLVLAGINVAHALPVLTLPEDITTDNDAGQCGAVVDFSVTATDDSGTPTVVTSPTSGSFFDVGETEVTVLARVTPSDITQGAFNVTVNDTEPPTVVTQDLEIVLDSNGEFRISLSFISNNAFVSRSDNCGVHSQINISGPSTYTCNNLGTSDGATIFSLDVNGNQTRSAITINVTDPLGVCNSAPVLAPIGNQTIDEGQLLEFTVSASDPDTGDTLTFQIGNPPTGAALTNNGDGTATFSWTPEFTQAGNFPDVLFTVNDDGLPAQADMETISITVGDVNRPPQFDALASQNSGEGVELSFNVQATDPDGNAITLTVSNSPSGAVFTDNGNGNGTFTWVPDFGQAGNYTVMFTATDDGAPMQSDTIDVTITIGDVNQPPVLSMIGNRVVVEDELLEIILTGSDPDGDNLSYSASNLPTGAAFNDNGDGTATFSWMPNFDQAGNYPNVLFTVTDNGVPAQSDSESITFTVGDGNRPPVFISIGNSTVVEGQLLEFTMNAFDPEGNNLSYTIGNTPAGATFNDNGDNTATFSWVPDFGQAGSYDVTFTVNDNSAPAEPNGGNTTTQTITIFVDMTISDQIAALKIASWNQVPDRAVRITANARLAQAIQYNKIASIYFQKNNFPVAFRYLNLAMSSVNQYISTLELGITKNKFSEQEVSSLLTAANAIIADMQRSLP